MFNSVTPGRHLSDFATGVLVGGTLMFTVMYYFLDKEKKNSKITLDKFSQSVNTMLTGIHKGVDRGADGFDT